MSAGAASALCWIRSSWAAHGPAGSHLLNTQTIFITRLIWTGILGEKAQPTYSVPCCALELLLFKMGGLFGARTMLLLLVSPQGARCHSRRLRSLASMRGPQSIAKPGCAPQARADRWGGHNTIFQKQGLVDF